MNIKKKIMSIGLVLALTFCSTSCGNTETAETTKSPLDPSNPTTITLWNYYNGDQLAAFDKLIAEFNSTVGVEEGIAVNSVSQGSIDNLADSLIDAADKKVGAQDMPTLAAVYSETSYILNQKGLLVNLDDYFTKEELAKYIPQFIEEGRLVDQGELLSFPVSKSTECFAVNKTDWTDFEKATGVTIDSIDSFESLTKAAKKYYEWTDSLTPKIKEDGKALYGRDSVANYIFIGAFQLGHELFKLTDGKTDKTLDKDTMRKLWDNYYIPYINGYFGTKAKYRSEDMKTSTVLAMTGSTSGVSYLPTEVTDAKDKTHKIEIEIKKPLKFANSKNIAVQQGAGYCVIKGTKQQQYAAAEFLKWFTEPERNLQFSASSGYSAVTIEANSEEQIRKKVVVTETNSKDKNMLDALLISADVYTNDTTYTAKPFDGSKSVRDIMGDALTSVTEQDRKAVVKAIKNGKTREEATAAYTTDKYFESWYQSLCDMVGKVVK